MKKIAILGATGSVGTQGLDVCRSMGYKVTAITGNTNVEKIEEYAREFKVSIAAMYNEQAAEDLKLKLADTNIKVLSGIDGICEAASETDAEIVLTAVVGVVGLLPTIAAIKAGKKIALANKETLVSGGELITDLVKEYGVKILPVDSEHGAIFQCLQAGKEVKKLILTASGGPFFGYDYEKLKSVTKAQALKHPNWSMGAKITIDSASMMNKGLELIEAVRLFNVSPENVEIVVHRESIIHSMVEFADNSVIAQLAVADMRLPIQYAFTYPERKQAVISSLDLCSIGKLSFYKPDYDTFKPLDVCRKAVTIGGSITASVNAANEEAVALFLNDRIKFYEIGEVLEKVLVNTKTVQNPTLEQIFEADALAREFVRSEHN